MNIKIGELIQYEICDFYNKLLESNSKSILKILSEARIHFIKLLCLIKTTSDLKLLELFQLLEQEDFRIEKVANDLYSLHSELKLAAFPNLDLLSAIDILTTGKYRQLPLICNVKSTKDTRDSLLILEERIKFKLFTEKDCLFLDWSVCDGILSFKFKDFVIDFTLFIGHLDVWRLMKFDILIKSPLYQGIENVKKTQTAYIQSECQKLLDSTQNLQQLLVFLHHLCCKYKLQIYYFLSQYLAKNTWNRLISSELKDNGLNIGFYAFSGGFKYVLVIGLRKLDDQELLQSLKPAMEFKLLSTGASTASGSKDVKGGLDKEIVLENVYDNEDEMDLSVILLSVMNKLSIRILSQLTVNLQHTLFQVCLTNYTCPMPFIEVLISDKTLSILINPQTGLFTLTLKDSLHLDQSKSNITQTLEKVESQLSERPQDVVNILSVLNFAIELERVEQRFLSLGYESVDAWDGDKLPDLSSSLYLKSSNDCGLVITLAYTRDWGEVEFEQNQLEYRIVFYQKHTKEKFAIVFEDMNTGNSDLNANDFSTINGKGYKSLPMGIVQSVSDYIQQYVTFTKTCTLLNTHQCLVSLMLPHGLECHDIKKIFTMQPKLCIRVKQKLARPGSIKDGLHTGFYSHRVVFLGMEFDNGVEYVLQTRFEYTNIVGLNETIFQTACFGKALEWKYNTDNFKEFFTHIGGFLEILGLVEFLVKENLVSQCSLEIESFNAVCLNFKGFGVRVQCGESKWKLWFEGDAEWIKKFGSFVGEALNSLSVYKVIQYVCALYPFLVRISEICQKFIKNYGTECQLQILSISEFIVTFYPGHGLHFQYLMSYFVVQDIVFANFDKKYDPIPFYRDSKFNEIHLLGLLSNIEKTFPQATILGNKIMLNADSRFDFIPILHQTIDYCMSLKLTEGLFRKLNAQKISFHTLRVMGIIGDKKIGFFANLREPWSTGKINIATHFCNFFFKILHYVPIGEKFHFLWCQLVVKFYDIPDPVLQDFLGLEGTFSSCKLVIRVPLGVQEKFPFLPSAGECCYLVDGCVIRFLCEFGEKVYIPFAYNYQTGVLGLWTIFNEWASMSPGPQLSALLANVAQGTDPVQRVLAISSSAPMTDSRVSKVVKYFISRPVEELILQ